MANTSLPQRRIEEIDFYNYIRRLLEAYNRSIVVSDIIDVFAGLGNAVPVVIKRLVQQIYICDAAFVPSKEEQVIAYKRLGYSMRTIRNITGIHPNTQYRILEKLKKDATQIPVISPKLDYETYMSMHALMEQIKKFKEI